MFVCQVDEGSKFAEQLDPEIFIIENEAYFLVERSRQSGNFIVIDLGQVRMKPGL